MLAIADYSWRIGLVYETQNSDNTGPLELNNRANYLE